MKLSHIKYFGVLSAECANYPHTHRFWSWMRMLAKSKSTVTAPDKQHKKTMSTSEKKKKQFSCYNIESKRMWIQHTIVKKKSGYGFYSNQFESSVEKAYTNFFFLSVSMLYLDFLVVHINISFLFLLQHHLASHPIDTWKTSQKTSQQRTRQQM